MNKAEERQRFKTRLVKDERDKIYLAKPVAKWTDHRVASILSYLQAAEFPRCFGWGGPAPDLSGDEDFCTSLKEIIVSPRPEQTCYLFEHIEGRSLAALREQNIGEEKIIKWMLHLAKSLSELAQILGKPLLHLDIKPGNIIIKDNDTPSLIDFDCALLLDDFARKWLEVKRATSFYAPPELLKAAPHANSDLYSLARTAISLLAAKPSQQIKEEDIESLLALLTAENKKIIQRWLLEEAKERADQLFETALPESVEKTNDQPEIREREDIQIEAISMAGQPFIQLPAIPLSSFDQMKGVSIHLEYKLTISPQSEANTFVRESKAADD